MSFRGRIFIALMGLGLAPLVVTGWLSYQTSREELQSAVAQAQMRAVAELAAYLETATRGVLHRIRLVSADVVGTDTDPEELAERLKISHRQFTSLTIVGLYRADGSPVVAPVRRHPSSNDPHLNSHEVVVQEDVEIFEARVPPLDSIPAEGLIAAEPHASAKGAPRILVATRTGSDPPLLLAAEMTMRPFEEHMRSVAEATGLAYAVAGGGGIFAASAPSVVLGEEERAAIDRVRSTGVAHTHSVARDDEREWFAAFGPVHGTDWTVVVGQPTEIAFGGAARVRDFNIAWAGVVLLLIVAVGALLSRALTQPIESLSTTVRALGEGRYDVRANLERPDELGQLANTLDRMASEIQRRDEEIRNWNEELKRRVDARTEELEAAQAQILRSQRLTALGSMGAGFAHELNNPMAGILGLVNLLLDDAEEGTEAKTMLTMIREQALRISGIVRSFQDFAEREQRSSGKPIAPIRVVRSALYRRERALHEQRIEVLLVHRDGVPHALGDEEQLTEALTRVIENAAEAMTDGGRLSLTIAGVGDGAIRVETQDTGVGIAPQHLERIFDPFFSTKTTAHNPGMGLSVAHQIIEAHGGEIQVKSEVGRGTTLSIILPAASADVHLV